MAELISCPTVIFKLDDFQSNDKLKNRISSLGYGYEIVKIVSSALFSSDRRTSLHLRGEEAEVEKGSVRKRETVGEKQDRGRGERARQREKEKERG